MRWITKYRKQRLGALAAAIAVTAWMPTAMAVPEANTVPTGANVTNGTATVPDNPTISQQDNKKELNITVNSPKAAIDWKSFDIGSNARVNFNGANGFMILNRVPNATKASEIYGELNGRGGTVFLINPQGVTFGAGASVDVGSLVASTRELTNDNFTNGNYQFVGEQKAAITNLANIKAENGVVALIAHKVENKGAISGRQVNLVSGDSVELVNLDNVSAKSSEAVLDYDNKIGVLVKSINEGEQVISLSKGGQVINSGTLKADNGFVLMKAKDAQNVMQDLVNAEKVSAANRIYKDDAGNMILLGDVNLVGDKVQVADGSKIDAESADKGAGTLNILSTNAIIDTVEAGNTKEKMQAVISATSLGDTLRDTNVNIVASPLQENYYSDITIGKAITKGKVTDTELVKDTSLMLTAGRNISVDAAITSEAGKLDVNLNGDNKDSTKSTRSDGAVIIRSNIATNGGDFVTTGDNGTYIGLSNEELTNLIYKEGKQNLRTISTKGGNISFGGNEVLLATGNTVVLDTEYKIGENIINRGSVVVDGTINSANAYSLRINRDSNGKEATTSWANANEAAKEYWKKDGKVIEGAKSYLAVITGALEDAVVSATIPPDTSNKSEAFVGGHVVAVKANENGVVELDENGNPQVLDKDGNVYNPDSDKDILIIGQSKRSNNIANGGWYKDAYDKPVRYWAWVDGNEKEKGTIFYIQTKGENVEKNYGNDPSNIDQWMEMSHGEKVIDTDGNEIYSNFAPGEPNDDKGEGGEGSQTALSVNYTSNDTTTAKNKFYAKWDDVCSNNAKYKYSVVETDLTPSSLEINAGDVTLNGAVGNLSPLNNMMITSGGKVDMNGSVQLNNALDVNAQNDITAAKFIDVGSTANLKSDSASVSTNAVTAGDKITLTAGKNVKISDKITSTKGTPVLLMASMSSGDANPDVNSIVITAQGSFENNVEDSANALNTSEGYYWKVYSADPTSKLGSLNSNEFAVWSWGKTGFQYNAANDSNNRFIFKATPEVVYTANDKTKAADAEMPALDYSESYMLNGSSLQGKYTANFKDGNIDALKSNYGLDKVEASLQDGVTPNVKGVYTNGIELKNTANAKGNMENFGYKTAFNPGTLTVTDAINPEPNPKPGDVKPQLDPHDTTNVDGSASYTTAPRQAGPGADRVLGLQSAELPFFREENGQTKLYGTYDVSIDPDKVKMEPTAKVLPEPDQPKNQYREYDKEITTKVGMAKFKLTYNGSTFDIYPVDIFGKKVLKAGDAAKNVEVESQALFAAFKEMGITLDDLDGVYTHFDNKKEVQSFRK